MSGITEHVEVLVIGAGIAGLSAALQLCNAGIRTKVLEARDRVGGRVHTVQHEGAVLELGAQWLHGGCHANNLFNFCLRHDLLGGEVRTLRERAGHFHTSSGRVIKKEVSDKAWDLYEELNEFAGLEGRDTRVSLRDVYWEFVEGRIEDDEDKDDLKLCMGGYACDDLKSGSAVLYAAGRELPGGDVIVPGGLASVLHTIINLLPGDVIQTGCLVSNIDWSASDIVVTSDAGKYSCDHVIITIPLGVLKNSHKVLITPNLDDEKVRALSEMREGRICKIFLEWNNPWWTSQSTPINLARSREEVEEATADDWSKTIFNLSPVEGQPRLLVCWVVGEAALVTDRLEDAEIINKVTELLRTFTGDPALPPPDQVIRHRWTEDPLSQGAYSCPGLGSSEADQVSLMRGEPSDERPRVMLAGEHTQPHYWSFLHGARLAGIQQADKIIQFKQQT